MSSLGCFSDGGQLVSIKSPGHLWSSAPSQDLMRSASLSPRPFCSGMLSADERSDCDIDMFSEDVDATKLMELLVKALLWEEEFGWSAGFFVTLEMSEIGFACFKC